MAKRYKGMNYIKKHRYKVKCLQHRHLRNTKYAHIPDRCQLGYKREGKKMIIDATAKDLVIRIFNMYLKGKSYQTIANILNEERVATSTKANLQNFRIWNV